MGLGFEIKNKKEWLPFFFFLDMIARSNNQFISIYLNKSDLGL
jgi:hypothetical protein